MAESLQVVLVGHLGPAKKEIPKVTSRKVLGGTAHLLERHVHC